jgi:hypothetical protein
MFTNSNNSNTTNELTEKVVVAAPAPDVKTNKYKNILQVYPSMSETNEMNYCAMDKILENEKLHNKSETWNKLDKTLKIQCLHAFAEKHGKEQSLPMKDIKLLKLFFNECLEKNKLQKTKDVIYDKESRTISSIPALFFNTINRNFTLKNLDAKRVSTLKSLTPKRLVKEVEAETDADV